MTRLLTALILCALAAGASIVYDSTVTLCEPSPRYDIAVRGTGTVCLHDAKGNDKCFAVTDGRFGFDTASGSISCNDYGLDCTIWDSDTPAFTLTPGTGTFR